MVETLDITSHLINLFSVTDFFRSASHKLAFFLTLLRSYSLARFAWITLTELIAQLALFRQNLTDAFVASCLLFGCFKRTQNFYLLNISSKIKIWLKSRIQKDVHTSKKRSFHGAKVCKKLSM